MLKQLERNSRSIHSSYEGNTIIEYMLISLLLVIFCVAAMQVLGSSFNLAIAKIQNDIKTHNQNTMAVLLKKNAQVAGLNLIMNQIQLDQLKMSLSDKLQTTGANGSTELLANQIGSTAVLLLAEGKIDQSQYNILMKLANQGHRMAQIETLIAQAVRMSNGNFETFTNIKFVFDGQTYAANQLTDLLGFNGPSPAALFSINPLDPSLASSADPELATFLSLYNQALDSGALSDPLALSTVKSATSQIASLGEIVESVSPQMYAGAVTTEAEIIALQASQASQVESSQICTVGNFQDNGILCRP